MHRNPTLQRIHTMQNMDKDSTIQIYLLYFSLFFFLWNMKSGSFEIMPIKRKEKKTNIMVHMWLVYLLLREIHL